jgi:hypothetical protein
MSFIVSVAGPTLTDLRQGVLDREAAIHSFTLSCHLDSIVRSPDGHLNLDGSEDIEVSAEVTGRLRYASSGTVHDAAGQRSEQVLGAFNGSEARSMQTRGSKTFRVGQIDPQRFGVSFRVDPLEFTTQYFGNPISFELLKPDTVCLGEDVWDGHPVQVVEVQHEPPEKGADYCKSRFWIDPSRGFAVVKRATLARRSPDEKWAEYYRAEGFDHSEVQPGLWVPMRVHLETVNVQDKNVEQGMILLSYKIQIKRWELNPPLGDSTFTFAFANGVHITDRISGRSFTTKIVSDQGLADQLAMDEVDGRRSIGRVRWILLCVNAALVLILVSFVVYRHVGRTAASAHRRS